jgi:hypothetical protein
VGAKLKANIELAVSNAGLAGRIAAAMEESRVAGRG